MARTTKNVIVPPTLEDAEMDRVIKDIYTILTDIKQSVNVASGEENTAKEGKIGDLRVVKNKASNTYSIEGKTEDGWVSTPANLQSSMTKAGAAVFPTAVISDGSLPTADYDSGWIDVTNDNTRHALTHGFNAQPRMFMGWFTPDSTYNSGDPTMYYPMDLGGLIRGGTSSWAGVEFRFTKTQIEYTCESSHHVYSNYRLDSGASSWTDYDDGYMRLLLWK
tara:strand:+ start:6230 stop:6892 length:663 start_codon:yes stop_codon:yes gene_type:complete